MRRQLLSFLFPAFLFTAACWEHSPADETDSGTHPEDTSTSETDADADADTDADTDTDVDTDSDGDSDTDSDMDTDTDTDTYCTEHDCWQTSPTGQELCYDDENVTSCTSFPCDANGGPEFCGQDAQYANNQPVFQCYDAAGMLQDPCDETADEGETVVDVTTGLEWQRTWVFGDLYIVQAWQQCEALSESIYGGHSDWRLPTLTELLGIVDYGKPFPPAIDTRAFPGMLAGVGQWPLLDYCTSSGGANGFDGYMVVEFLFGSTMSFDYSQVCFVRCVRP